MTLSLGLFLIALLALYCLSTTSISKEQQTALAQSYIQTIKYRNLVMDLGNGVKTNAQLTSPLYSTSINGLSEPAMCLAPIEAFLSIMPASSNFCISLPFFIIFGLLSTPSSIFNTASDSSAASSLEF